MKKRILNIFVMLIGMISITVMFFPIATIAAGSVMSRVEIMTYYRGENVQFLKFFPDRFTLSQFFDALIENTEYTRALLNTVSLSFTSTLLSMIISIPAAYALAFYKIPFKRVILALYLIIMLLPYQALEIPHFLILREIGLIGTESSTIVTNIFDTFEPVILTFLFMTVSNETLEAAAIDGAGIFRILLHVVIPQMKHGIFTVMLLKLINVWNITEQPIMFLDNTTQYPLSVILPNLSEIYPQSAFAFGLIFILPILLIYLCFGDSLAEIISTNKINTR